MPPSNDALAKYRPSAGSQITFLEFNLNDAVSFYEEDDDGDGENDEIIKAAQQTALILEQADPAEIRKIRRAMDGIGHSYHNFLSEFMSEIAQEALSRVANLDIKAPPESVQHTPMADNICRNQTPMVHMTVRRLIDNADIGQNRKNRLNRFMSNINDVQQDAADQAVADALGPHADALAQMLGTIAHSMVDRVEQLMRETGQEEKA